MALRLVVTILGALLLCGSAQAQNKLNVALRKTGHSLLVLGHKPWFQPIEHMALGAGVEISVASLAGGQQHYLPGLLAAGLVGGFKEGTDVINSKDTKKSAGFDFLEIVAGAGASAATFNLVLPADACIDKYGSRCPLLK